MALNIMNRAETEKVGNSANILKSLRAYYPDLVDFQQIFEQSKQNGNYINCFDIIMDETLALRPTPGEVVDFYSFYASKIVEVIETYKQNHTDGDYRALAVELYSKLDLDKAIKLGKGKQGNIYSALADNLPIEVLSEIVVSNMDLFTLNDAEVSKVEEYLSQNESVITQYKFFKKYPALCDKQNLLDRLLMEYKELEETIVTKPNLNISEDEVDAINNRRYRKSYEGGNIEGVEYSPCTKDDVMRKKLNEYFSEIDYKERTMKEFRHMIDEISSAIQADKKACQKPASQDGGQDDSREL